MNKRKLMILSLMGFISLIACNGGGQTSSGDASSSLSELDSSFEDSYSSFEESFSSFEEGNNSSTRFEGLIDQETALNLVVRAEIKDIGTAKTSESSLLAIGYDGGRRYNQTQTISSTSYLNDLTVSHGTVSQYFYDNEDVVFEDEFYEVKLLDENNYITAKDYVSDMFEDEIQQIDLLLMDPSAISDNIVTAQAEISCGAGSQAISDLYNTAIVNEASVYYTARNLTNGNLELVFTATAENSQSNQKYIAEFTYIFDSLQGGFLLNYTSEQSYYPLSTYNNADDVSTLEPTYYAKYESEVKKGILTQYEGELPVDVSQAFVSEIRLSASKTTIEVDEVIAIKYQVLPQTALNKDLRFTSSNQNVARVDSFGRVTGIGEGTCEIIATNVESGVEGKLTINVVAKSRPDAGDDNTKGDLQIALSESIYRVFTLSDWIGGDYVESISGMCIDSEASINSLALSQLSISDFAYDENLRKATYVGDYSKLENIIPFYDNGNENLSNSYLLKNNYTMYHDVTLGFELYLAGDNTIHYLKFDMSCGYVDSDTKINLAELTNENIEEKLGEFFAGYKRNMYYVSQGVVIPDEE